jgi:hypothetical protein
VQQNQHGQSAHRSGVGGARRAGDASARYGAACLLHSDRLGALADADRAPCPRGRGTPRHDVTR